MADFLSFQEAIQKILKTVYFSEVFLYVFRGSRPAPAAVFLDHGYRRLGSYVCFNLFFGKTVFDCVEQASDYEHNQGSGPADQSQGYFDPDGVDVVKLSWGYEFEIGIEQQKSSCYQKHAAEVE